MTSSAQGTLFERVGELGLERVAPAARTALGKVASAEASGRIPGFVLDALGDALQSVRHRSFSFEEVRLIAERAGSVRDWLGVSTRRNVLGGWTRSRIKLFKLQRAGDVEARRDARRGARCALWRFPTV